MKAFHGKPSDFPLADYQLAEKLGQTPEVIRQLPHQDYVNLVAYFNVKQVLHNMRAEHASKQR
ncbi:MAG: hypothetical protein AB1679_14335 [Actinomycetota bacterium]|jgi:hypothetical protein